MTAWDDYASAAHAAGVDVRILAPDELAAASALWTTIWGEPVLDSHLLTALVHSGNYVAGAFAGDRLVAAAGGFFSQPVGHAMHSHVAGVAADAARTGIGTALKLHQRAWCLDIGVTEVTWTFDPLIARNAGFNIARLGAVCDAYYVNHYGAMTDGINAGDESDRIVARWHLDRPMPTDRRALPADAAAALSVGADGTPAVGPIPSDARAATLALPRDIETLRRASPTAGRAWRFALREVLVPALADGWEVTAVDPDHGYLIERTS